MNNHDPHLLVGTIKGLKECRAMELRHLKFRQAKRTKRDIEIAKHF